MTLYAETFYAAPSRAENFSGPRTFAYLAEVDILGWKFRAMQDGRFVIDTPIVAETGANLMLVVTSDGADLLASLLAMLPQNTDELQLPENWTDVGRIA